MMRTSLPYLLAATSALACAPTTPRPARDRIRFEHGPHLVDGTSCTECHEGATKKAEKGDAGIPPTLTDLSPSEGQCLACHEKPEEKRCAFCHTEPRRASGYRHRYRRVHFDHTTHDAPKEGKCVECHGRSGQHELARTFEPKRPTMRSCTKGCHQADMRQLDCARCHVDLHDYRPEDLLIVRHPVGFLGHHGTSARADGALCTQCHEPAYCEDCHLAAPGVPLELITPVQSFRAFVHRGDFLARHGVEARLEQGSCLTCHSVRTCDGCHQESGVGGSVGAASPHPPGWLDPLSPRGHARAARRDLMTCAGCHESDAERVCVPCHRVGGLAQNPHPPGFGAGMDPLRHGVCRTCHAP